ncbi:substrate-binding domain-containing protein [Ferrovibrio terrae]|uniref:substrate-binding domain-containing protein n=1 Tax=Ferrovibrio terrae TaxID=2594003 RepID=UPI0031376E0D
MFILNFNRLPIIFTAMLILATAMPSHAADARRVETVQTTPVRVGGTGMGLALMRAVGDQIEKAAPAIDVQVLPSLGTAGGINALAAKAIDVAIATRPAGADEITAGIETAACLSTALIFATSRSESFDIKAIDLPALYREVNPQFPDGRPLKIILRSRTGSEVPYLIKRFPALEEAFTAAYRRTGIPVGATDQENAVLAQRTADSFAITTLLQVRAEKLTLTPLSLDGVMPAPQTIADGSYPIPLKVCLLVARDAAPAVRRVASYITTPAGRKLVRAFGAEVTP